MFYLLGQIFSPYNDISTAWAFGTVLICSGLITAAILPSITAQYNLSLDILKLLTSIMGFCYLVLIWIPDCNYPIVSFFIATFLGAAFFNLIPITLEYLVDIAHPIAPESTSSLCWAAGLLLGAWFTLIMEVLAADDAADPPYNMKR